MNEKNTATTGGIGFFGLLTIVFIVLKLCKVISWSWVWILAPTWIPLAAGTILIGIALLFYLTK